MWNIYDDSIAEIPDDLRETVNFIHVGGTWTVVKAGDYTGVAATVNEQNKTLKKYDHLYGKTLKEVSHLCKSWDFMEASVGTAALNAYVNSPDHLKDIPHFISKGGFEEYGEKASGKKVAIIGHFRGLERFLTKSETYVLERKPRPGDYPDPACEYILPDMDYVFITGSAFINKTLPRLIRLSRFPIMLGASTPMTKALIKYGAKELSGYSPRTLTKDVIIETGDSHGNFKKYGLRISVVSPGP